jgi:hypothetical protein
MLSEQTSHVQADLLTHAYAYAARGWSIIPCQGKVAAGLWRPFQRKPTVNTLRMLIAKTGLTGLDVIDALRRRKVVAS